MFFNNKILSFRRQRCIELLTAREIMIKNWDLLVDIVRNSRYPNIVWCHFTQ